MHGSLIQFGHMLHITQVKDSVLLTLFNLKSEFLPCLWSFSSQTKDIQLWFLWLALISTRAEQMPSFYAIRIYFPSIIPFYNLSCSIWAALNSNQPALMAMILWFTYLRATSSSLHFLFPPLDLLRQTRELENPAYLLQLLTDGIISIHQSGLT